MIRFIVLILLCSSIWGYAQDPLFSQSDLNMLYTNPAYAGSDKGARFLIHRRDQWNGISSETFHTNYIEMNQFLGKSEKLNKGKQYGLGFHLISDMENSIFQVNEFGSSFSITFFNRQYLFAGGSQLSIIDGRMQTSNLIFTDQINYYNSIIGPLNQENIPLTGKYREVSLGWGSLFSWLYGGKDKETTISFSIFNIGESRSFNKTENYRSPLRIHTHLSHEFTIENNREDNFEKTINVFLRLMRQIRGFNNPIEIGNRLEIGSTFALKTPYTRKLFILGTMYRKSAVFDGSFMSESLVPIIRIKPSKRLVINYSYDINISRLTNYFARSTHELGLIFILNKEPKKICKGVNPLFD